MESQYIPRELGRSMVNVQKAGELLKETNFDDYKSDTALRWIATAFEFAFKWKLDTLNISYNKDHNLTDLYILLLEQGVPLFEVKGLSDNIRDIASWYTRGGYGRGIATTQSKAEFIIALYQPTIDVLLNSAITTMSNDTKLHLALTIVNADDKFSEIKPLISQSAYNDTESLKQQVIAVLRSI